MAYNLKKRIATLQQQVDDTESHKLSFGRAVLIVSITYVVLSLLLIDTELPSAGSEAFKAEQAGPQIMERPKRSLKSDDFDAQSIIRRLQGSETQNEMPSNLAPEPLAVDPLSELDWLDSTRREVESRAAWLGNLPLGKTLGSVYLSIAENLVRLGLPSEESFSETEVEGDKELDLPVFLDLYEVWVSVVQGVVSFTLRLCFMLLAFWLPWLLAVGIGFGIYRYSKIKRSQDPILDVCDRKVSPFYSGIFGPLNSNGGLSGTDLACVGLACPPQASKNEAASHQIAKVLRGYSALNETTLALLQILLAARDYPSFVEDERPVEEDNSNQNSQNLESELTLEESVSNLLPAILQAHRAIQRAVPRGEDPSVISNPELYERNRTSLLQLSKNLSPLSKALVLTLTATRAQALNSLSATDVACAYLALEAGKSLVFKKSGQGYVRISQFPHLQARAVLHSVPSYSLEFSGEQRLIIRQAIICSRRHGDFARAFLPDKMPLSSRALRDWLEVLSAHPDRQLDIARLVELDAQTDEVRLNWRKQLSDFLRGQSNAATEGSSYHIARLARGIVHKSVVLVPRSHLIKLALLGFSEARLGRVSELMSHAQKFQHALTVSARLPGFKRQIEESEKLPQSTSAESPEVAPDSATAVKWTIVRRMLTRYNWLSTRVGDDAVPNSGLVYGIINEKRTAGKSQVIGLDSLVPLRQRRFEELFGQNWEHELFYSSYHHDDVTVFVDYDLFQENLKGSLNNPARSAAPEDDSQEPQTDSKG